MTIISPSAPIRVSSPRCSNRSFVAAGALALGLLTPGLTAQLDVKLSSDNQTFNQTLSILDASEKWVYVQVTADATEANDWVGATANCYLDPANNSYSLPLDPVTTAFGSFARTYDNTALTTYDGLFQHCLYSEGAEFLASALLDNGVQSGTQVTQALDLLIPAVGVDPIVQPLGTNPNTSWPVSDFNTAINMDAVLQEALWRRVEGTGQYNSMDAFLGHKDYWHLRQEILDLPIQLVSMRGPDGSTSSGLTGFPLSGPPTFKTSATSLLKFGGSTQQGEIPNFSFAPANSNPFWMTTFATPGDIVTFGGAGYLPGMQVAIELVGGAPGPRYEFDLYFDGYGMIKGRIPHTAQLGTYRFTQFRQVKTWVGGLKTYTAWEDIDSNYSPRVAVQ